MVRAKVGNWSDCGEDCTRTREVKCPLTEKECPPTEEKCCELKEPNDPEPNDVNATVPAPGPADPAPADAAPLAPDPGPADAAALAPDSAPAGAAVPPAKPQVHGHTLELFFGLTVVVLFVVFLFKKKNRGIKYSRLNQDADHNPFYELNRRKRDDDDLDGEYGETR